MFILESCPPQRVTLFATEAPQRQSNDIDCWADVKKHYNLDKP